MKLKFKKHKNQYLAGIHRGNGGVSSMVASRCGGFWHCLKMFFIVKYYFLAVKK